MYRFLGPPPATGGTERARVRPIRGALTALVVILVVVGSGAFWALATAGPGAPSAPPSTHLSPEALPPTHGDLVVTSGEVYTIRPTASSHTYYQGGNITVEAGGTLNVVNVSLTFVQFVGDTGTAQSRLSHIYHFTDAGQLNFNNASLTTDVQVLNAYAKLTVSVTGNLSVVNSTFAFPGWIDVAGASATAVFNHSLVRSNGNVLNVSEPGDIQADTSFAPILDATGGAHVSFFSSAYRNMYENDFLLNTIPSTTPLYDTNHVTVVPGGGTYNFSALRIQNDSANLTRDWAYPAGISGALVQAIYENKVNMTTSANVSVEMNGKTYPFGNMSFGSGPLAGALTLANASSQFINALNTAGVMNYLNWTGGFDAGPLKIAILLKNVAGGADINITEIWLTLLPSLSFNLLETGAGTNLNVVNSAFDLTWNNLPASTFSIQSPYPWFSNKLVMTNGATAYLANLTAVSSIPNVFSTSVVVPDASSKAYFYRWAEFNITGRGGELPIVNAAATAFYSYKNQSNNETANALNDLATANPAIWHYVEYWDGQHGLPGYGMTGRLGKAYLLLAVGNLTGPTLPDGYFLGSYHFGVTIPIASDNSEWFNWSLQPYPSGVANGTSNYGGPDHGPNVTFDAYYSSVTVGTIGVTENGTALTGNTIAPARSLGIDVPLTNTGTAEIYNLSGTLYYGNPVNGTPIATVPFHNVTLTPLESTWVNFTWYVTSAITGIYGTANQLFSTNITYNSGIPTVGGGYLTPSTRITVAPYFGSLAVASVTLDANNATLTADTVRIGETLQVHVVLNYSGTFTLPAYTAQLWYNPPNATSQPLVQKNLTGLHLDNTGQQTSFWLNWTVVDTIVGLEKKTFLHNFTVSVGWLYFVDNLGQQVLVINNTGAIAPAEIAPSEVVIATISTPPSTLDLSSSYVTAGLLRYNGSQEALLLLYAIPVGQIGGILIGSSDSRPGNYSVPWVNLNGVLSPGSKYTLQLQASYNGVTAYYNLSGPFSVPSSSSSPGFFFQTFLGLPLWLWLAIAAGIVVAIVAVLLISRRQAAGKLVECGECGNLIPEDATVCPKCGAEFESDLIRCSRCASTIPADSQFCPECAAQLLGKPGEGEADPERQGYADFTERYRSEAKKELGENYNEGSFWDWWKRQPTYTSFSQWKLQQGQGASRAGMSAPPVGTVEAAAAPSAGKAPPTAGQPPKGGAGGAAAAPAAAGAARTGAPPPAAAPPAPAGNLKPCPTCGKEIPPEYLVCPFCGSVTQ